MFIEGNHTGWLLTLPSLADSRIVLFDPGPAEVSAEVASHCDWLDVLTLPQSVTAHRSRLEAENISNVRVWSVADSAKLASLSSVDGVIWCELAGTDLDKARTDDRWSTLQAILSANKQCEFAYVLVNNPLSLSGLGRYKNPARLLRDCLARWRQQRGLARLARLLGGQRTTWPLMEYNNLVQEVLVKNAYVPVKNRFSRSEKIKSLLLRGPGAALWVPAQGVCLENEDPGRTTLIKEVERSLIPGSEVQACWCLQGKTIIKVSGAEGGQILVFPHSPKAEAGRTREAEILQQLAPVWPEELPAPPRVLGPGVLAGRRFFRLTLVEGETVDGEAPYLADYTRQAVQWLVQFQLHTRDQARADVGQFRSRLDMWLARCESLYPCVRAHTSGLRDILSGGLEQAEKDAVWQHGDYKIENVMRDAASGTISGVIDWELSEPRGLPYLDLLYLIQYNRQLRGEPVFSALASILKQDFSAPEKEWIQYYTRRTGIEWQPSFYSTALLIHHITERVQYPESEHWVRQGIENCLGIITNKKIGAEAHA